jgi:hypothetical protein
MMTIYSTYALRSMDRKCHQHTLFYVVQKQIKTFLPDVKVPVYYTADIITTDHNSYVIPSW